MGVYGSPELHPKLRENKVDKNRNDKNRILNYIIGFRNDILWHKVVSVICYVLIIMSCLIDAYSVLDFFHTLLSCLFFIYLVAAFTKLPQGAKRWHYIIIAAVILFCCTIISNVKPQADNSDTGANSFSSESSTENQTDLSQSWNDLKESLGIATESEPEDEPFNPSYYVSAPAYDKLARYPDNYKNGMYKFYGKAIQVSDGIFNTIIRLELHDDFNQIVYCEVPKELLENRRILEQDYVTMYGVYKGVTTYTTILGANITVPKIVVTQFMY